MLRKESFICTACGKVNYGDGAWSEIDIDSRLDFVSVICPDCSHDRFPQLYSDYKKPEESFGQKIIERLFRWKDKK